MNVALEFIVHPHTNVVREISGLWICLKLHINPAKQYNLLKNYAPLGILPIKLFWESVYTLKKRSVSKYS